MTRSKSAATSDVAAAAGSWIEQRFLPWRPEVVPSNDAVTTADVTDWLAYEAALLDVVELRDWLALTTDDIVYQVAPRLNRERDRGPQQDVGSLVLDDDRSTLLLRIDRLDTELAWAEDPPSRTRHHLSNIRWRPREEPDEIDVVSDLLLYRNRGDWTHAETVSAMRRDVWRWAEGELNLARRLVVLDQATLGLMNLPILF